MPTPGNTAKIATPNQAPLGRVLLACALWVGMLVFISLLLGTSLSWRTQLWAPMAWVGAGLSAVFVVSWAVRLVMWWRYRAMAPSWRERNELPSLSVIIPAFNEGVMVRRSIESVLASRYPSDRLHIIVVNDGSRDDTGAHIDAVAAESAGRVTAIHLPKNRGKRHALHAGFRHATSEIVATVDSDSIVLPDSLANMVTPFLRDARIAGVGGKVVAYNRRENLLTRMLGVRYILGFDFVRAYQSGLRTVWCCPGALQAYRRDVIAPHLDRWLGQRFLGAACTNGDDHAMTNLVLSLGHDTVYQSNAVVETLVPNSYVRLCKMYVRWGRSATREGLRALRFAFPRARRLGAGIGPLMLMDAVLQPVTVLSKALGIFATVAIAIFHPVLLLKATLASLAVASFYCLIFLRSERSTETFFGLLYAVFAMVALVWVQPFATLTVRRNGWLTRE
ncbi:MAG: glycosyltransferase [Myxococcota bacterium]